MMSRQIEISEQTQRDGAPAVVITTATARYVYDTIGGGFSALLDRRGHDWISNSRAQGPAGEDRGIPNMVFRRDVHNNHFHPGHRAGPACTTEVSRNSDDSVRIESYVGDRWQVRWDVSDAEARFTTERIDPDDPRHWFLYEGTPGGRFRPRDRFVRSDGLDGPLSQGWETDTSLIDWVAFVSKKSARSLLFKWETSTPVPVSYYPKKPMTVFGLGRRLRSAESHLTTTSSVTMTFVESTSFNDLAASADAIAG